MISPAMDVPMLSHALPVKLDLILQRIFAFLNVMLENFGTQPLQPVKIVILKQPNVKNVFLKPIRA